MSKRCAQAAIVPWLVMIPLGFLLALIAPRLIRQRQHEPVTAATNATTPARDR